MSIFTIVILIFAASQFYWAWRAYRVARRLLPSPGSRTAVCAALLALYLFLVAFNFGWFGSRGTPVHLTVRDALLVAPFLTWMAGSIVGFFLALVLAVPQGVVAV